MNRAACMLGALLCGLAPALRAQTEGYVGIYADAAGTQPCAYVAPNTATALYVIAKTAGSSAAGITGAEFRVEVTSPTGWLFSYTSPSGAQALGDPIDTNPDPDAGGGMNIAFSTCQQPVAGTIALGTISVFNAGGSATNLLVKRHSTPRNVNYACPLFVLCDSPSYTKVCMGTSTEQPGCLAPQKGRRTSTEPVAFDLPVNPTAIPEPVGESFTRTLDLGNSELWVMGQPIPGPQVSCSFDGSVLAIAGVPVPISPTQMPQRTFTAQELTRTYGSVPAVQERLAAGATIHQAAALYVAEREALYDLAAVAFRRAGPEGARGVLNASPLVDRVEMDGEILVWMKGVNYFAVLNTAERRAVPINPRGLATRRLDTIARALAASPFQGSLVMVTHDGVGRFGGDSRLQAKAQAEHIRQGGAPAALPPGPLRLEDSYLQDVARAANMKRTK